MKLLVLLSLFVIKVAIANTTATEILVQHKFANALIENVNGLTGDVVRYTSHCNVNTLIRENGNQLYIYEVVSGCADLSSMPNPRSVLLTIDGQNIMHGNDIVGTKQKNNYFLRVNFNDDNLFINNHKVLQKFAALCSDVLPDQLLIPELKSYYELKMTKNQNGKYTIKQSWSSDVLQVIFHKGFKSKVCLSPPVVHVGRQTITIDQVVPESSL